MSAPRYPRTTYEAGAVGPDVAQRRGILRRFFDGQLADRVAMPRHSGASMVTIDAPRPRNQRIRARARIVDAVVPSSTGSDLLPNNRRPTPVWDGEPGANSPITFDGGM